MSTDTGQRKIGKVLWTDKSKFEVFGSQGRAFVRCRKTENMLEECLTSAVKHGGGNVLVWGCFGGGKVGHLFRVKGILKKQGYHSILQRHAWPAVCLTERKKVPMETDRCRCNSWLLSLIVPWHLDYDTKHDQLSIPHAHACSHARTHAVDVTYLEPISSYNRTMTQNTAPNYAIII